MKIKYLVENKIFYIFIKEKISKMVRYPLALFASIQGRYCNLFARTNCC